MNFVEHRSAGGTAKCFLGLLLFVWVTAPEVCSQTSEDASSNCKIGSRAPQVGFWRWEPGSHVKVYILQNDFSNEEIPYLIKPLRLWDAVSESTGSGVKITYAGTTTTPLECLNCVTIVRARIHNTKTRHGGELKAYGVIKTRIIKYATLTIDPKMKSQSLTNAVAHELGHSFGLLDCFDCKDGSTVMLQFTGPKMSNNMEGPSDCDVAQIRKVYKELKARIPEAVAIVPEDEGEQPVPDDTPLVVPQP